MKVPQKGGRLLFLVLVSIFSFNTSHVCACLGETYSITERVQNAPIVFEGVVIQMGLVDISTEKIDYGSIEASSLSTIGDPNLKTEARIIVKRYIKGDGPPVVTVRGFGGLGGGDCQSRVKIGDHALFFAIETSVSGTLTPAYLGVYSATESIQTGVLAEALSATNQEPTLYLPFVHGKLISVLVIALYSLPIYGLAGGRIVDN
ncbi:MAG: hypothetical protein H6662_16530 [Ardenticatenaceae bacterium]|nr:hypothetical protein [Ardenticatenaceae bacterium]